MFIDGAPSTRRKILYLATALSSAAQVACGRHPHPLWRGFNLQEKFTDRPDEWASLDPEWGHYNEPFRESDFEQIAELGFNFVRLPMSYRCWTDPTNPYRLLEATLAQIDQAVAWGRQYGLHVCLNFHRAPGYCINGSLSPEPWNLWTEERALDIFTHHWVEFARRYAGIPSERLSFNLINEPNACTVGQYVRVMAHTVRAIREIDPGRLIVVDGMFGETMPPAPELAALTNVVHSTRGYAPFALTHYLAPWAGSPNIRPAWPTTIDGAVVWDRDRLDEFCVLPHQGLQFRKPGARVLVGEWGCWNKTPHNVTLAWMKDFLSLWKKARWSWALWCFRGSFGILDSGRSDVTYERWRGHDLDREMLEMLQQP